MLREVQAEIGAYRTEGYGKRRDRLEGLQYNGYEQKRRSGRERASDVDERCSQKPERTARLLTIYDEDRLTLISVAYCIHVKLV